MAVEIRLPKLTDEMEEGTVIRWLKQVGEPVAEHEPLVEVETEKVIVEVEATSDGVLLEIVAVEQEVVPVDAVLCLIGEAGEKPAARPAAAASAAAAVSSPRPASNVVPMVQPQPPGGDEAEGASRPGPTITPLARRVAGELGIDLSAITGTGIGGKIIMSDLQPFLGAEPGGSHTPVPRQPAGETRGARAARPSDVAPHRRAAAAVSPAGEEFKDVPLSPMRSTVARRMGQSKREIPHFYMTSEIDVSDLLALRKRLNRKTEDGKITVNDMMVKAAAAALSKVPDLNAEFREGVLRRYDAVHMGLAVAMEGGLVTPVVRDCGRKSIAAIARETRDLVERARRRKLRPEEMQGGTFTLSNLGMYDVVEFSAIINPPQVGILAIARPVERPVVKNGWVVVSSRLQATLSADHRAIDGAAAAGFLEAFKSVLEDPERLLML